MTESRTRPVRIWTPDAPTRLRFGDLQSISLDEHIAAAPKDALWFFLHIPKTAGSSLSTELSWLMPPYHNISISDAQRQDDYDAGIRQALDDFVTRPDLARFRSASGHLLHPMSRKIWEHVPSMEMVTFLRNPVNRVISDYRYQRTEMHPGWEEFRRRFPTLKSFVDDPVSQNQMAYFIGGGGVGRGELMTRIKRDFAFVGLVEMYPFSFNTMFALMGLPGRLPQEHVRKTPDTAETSVTVDHAMRRHIRRLNGLDADLYAEVRDILGPHVEDWRRRRREAATGRDPSRGGPSDTSAG